MVVDSEVNKTLELYMNLLENDKIEIDAIPAFWREQIINKIEDMLILNEEISDKLKKYAPESDDGFADSDIEEYLNSENTETSLDEGVVSNE